MASLAQHENGQVFHRRARRPCPTAAPGKSVRLTATILLNGYDSRHYPLGDHAGSRLVDILGSYQFYIASAKITNSALPKDRDSVPAPTILSDQINFGCPKIT